MLHLRKDQRHEVDLVVERLDGKVLAVDVKAARSLGKGARSGIAAFRTEYPNFFHRGYVIHAGDHVQQLAHDVWSIPFSALWIGDEIRPTRSAALADRLAWARQRIEVQRGAAESNAAQREWLAKARIDGANRHFGGGCAAFRPRHANTV